MIKILSYILGTIVAIIALLLIASTFPIKGNYQLLIVQSGSMEPAIKTGSIVVVKPASKYQTGDVITFGQMSKTKIPTTHRIIDSRQQNGTLLYTTKGDANEGKDASEVPARQIIGKVLFDIPFLGYALATAKKPAGFAVLIIIPALILLFDEVKNIFLEIKKMRKKKREEKTLS